MELFWEPRTEALKRVAKVENEPEMSEFESAFLCGLIKENRPKKILEIGVAAGGTTAIVMQCIDMLGMNDGCEFISVDINEKFYRGDGRDTGFLGRELKEKMQSRINHQFYLGKVLPERIEQIGSKIDLVILDTVHFLPGEVLDFPVLLPFLSSDAIVVLHDVAYHQYSNKEGMATQVLLDVATGNKIVPMGFDKAQPTKMPNIGGVQINEDTKKYVDAVFHAMLLPWHYLPKDDELEIYRDFYSRHYDEDLVEVYDTAIELNKHMLSEHKGNKQSFSYRVMLAARMILKGY